MLLVHDVLQPLQSARPMNEVFKSTNPAIFTQVCVNFSSHLISRGFAPTMPQHHIERAHQSCPLPDLPSWAYDLRLPCHAYLPPSGQERLEADLQADGILVVKLYYAGVVGEVDVEKEWFELLPAPSTSTSTYQLTIGHDRRQYDVVFDDTMISIASSSIHTMELMGRTSLIKTGDLMFSLRPKCFEEGVKLFFSRRTQKGTNQMQLVYSRPSGDVKRRGDKRNVDQRVIPSELKVKVRIW